MTKQNLSRSRYILLEPLEDRTLFDALPMLDPALLEVSDPGPPVCQSQDLDCSDAASRTEVVFVDAGVPDADKFLADLAADSSGQVEFHYLDTTADGLKQIADLLVGRADIDAIHVVSHGNQAQLLLGSARIGRDDLDSVYRDELQQIGAALASDGDILIYGCDLAGSQEGQEFVGAFAMLTGADVAASEDLTGHASLGGDWVLEVAAGQIDADTRLSSEFVASYAAVLSDPGVDLYVSQDDNATSLDAGQSLVYTVEYGNDGTADATGVVLSESMPAGATFDATNSSFGWVAHPTDSGIYQYHLGSVFAGTSGAVTFALNVDDSVSAGVDQIAGQVSIADDGSHGVDADSADNSHVDVNVLHAAPDLHVTTAGSASVASAGDTVTYTVNYGNRGTQDATGVVLRAAVSDDAAMDLSNSSFGWIETPLDSGAYNFYLGTVQAGTSGAISLAVKINDSVSAGVGQIVSNVSIVDDGENGPDEDAADNSASDTIAITAAPAYQVAMEDGQSRVTPGESVAYTVRVANIGTMDGAGISIIDTLPVNAFETIVADQGGVVNASAGTVSWNLPLLRAQETAQLTIVAQLKDTFPAGFETIENTIVVADGVAEEKTSTDVDVLDAFPDLAVTISTPATVANDGEGVSYTLTYANHGTQDATRVVLRDHLPAGTAFDPANSTAGWVDLGSGLFEFSVGSLPAGETKTTLFAITAINAEIAGDVLTNSASIHDDGANGPDLDSADNSSSVDMPLVVEDTPTDGDGTPTDGEDPPTDEDGTPTDGEDPPTDEDGTPTDGEDPPTDEDGTPTDGEDPPTDEDGTPTGGEYPPTDEDDPPTDGEDPPTNEDDAPTDGEEPPTDGDDTPTDGEDPPTDEDGTPTDGEDPPTDEDDTPTDGEDPPTDEDGTPTDGEDPPTDEDDTPTDEENPPTSNQLSTIGGFVYVDTDGNGEFTAAEMPLAGVEISLRGIDDAGNSVLLVSTTDTTGSYRFDGVHAGSYVIVESQPDGWQDGRESASSPEAVVSGNDEISLVLRGGESLLGNNFGEAGLPAKTISPRHFLASASPAEHDRPDSPNGSAVRGEQPSQSNQDEFAPRTSGTAQGEQSPPAEDSHGDTSAKIGSLRERLARWSAWLRNELGDAD